MTGGESMLKRKIPYETGGFAFSDKKMMEKAIKETEGIAFAKKKIDKQAPESVLPIYQQMVERQLFRTPVGYSFLFEVQKYLKTAGSIDPEQIPPIPVEGKYENETEKESKKELKKEKVETVREIKEKNVDFKRRFYICVYIIVVLFMIIIGMFAVTVTSDNINILNYENALIEKYEMWERELEEREAILEERENKMSQ